MFSKRASWTLSENAIARAVAARRKAGVPFIDLTETNPTHVGLGPAASLLLPVAGVDSYDPLPLGLETVRAAVARYHREQDAGEHICLTASTSEAYSWLFKLLCDPGDSVLIPSPGYPLFDDLARLESVELAPYASRSWDDWSIDFDDLRAKLTPRTKAVIVVAPNNPTGALLHEGDYEQLVELCRENNVALISDEVFADYVTNATGRVRTIAGEQRVLTFVLSGLSKVCLTPQLKVGWIAVSGPASQVVDALGRLEMIADSFLSVSTPSQLLVPKLLDRLDEIQRPLKERLACNRQVLASVLRDTAASLLPCDGGWSAVLRVPQTRTEEAWVLHLLEAGVLVHPGFFFDFAESGYLVLSLIVPAEDFALGAARLAHEMTAHS